jgi:pyruvate formate lyase activating enzyme
MLHGNSVDQSGIVFDIQHYSIYDGPGIRTCVFFKGCPLHCAWCHNPESQNYSFELMHDHYKCTLCGNCVRKCRQKALTITRHSILRNKDACAGCGECVKICTSGAMEWIGKKLTSREIARCVVQNLPFFSESGGGVTISGGEPTAQKDFLIDTLNKIRQNGIHTAIETSGFFSCEIIPELARSADLFLFDIKHIDEMKLVSSTGVTPEKILGNFIRIVADYGSEKIIPRIPLIPGFNTDSDSLLMITSFLKMANYSGIVHLLPYNNLSKHKYEKLGRSDQFTDKNIIEESQLQWIQDLFQKQGFSVYCNA